MTILGRGDLAPPRRGRRRRTPVVGVLLALALAAGGWYGWQAWSGATGTSAHKPRPVVCVTPTPAPSPGRPKAVKVAVLNGTKRVGLAHTVAGQLTLRGFAVVRVGNGGAATGAPVVGYPAGDLAAALAVAEQVPGARLVELPKAPPGVIQLQITAGFRQLATPSEVTAARAHDLAVTAPSPAACSTPRG